MSRPPTGTVTFLFTDIEGSTQRWQQSPGAMQTALERHHALLQGAIASSRGYVFQIVGDAFCAAFHTPQDGLAAAVAAQRGLTTQAWGDIRPIRVRMAVHTGTAEVHAGDYKSGEYVSGLTLSRVARLLSAAHGGQVLVSQATQHLVRDQLPATMELRDLGELRLRDLARAERVFQLVAPDLPATFPPLRAALVAPSNLPVQRTRAGWRTPSTTSGASWWRMASTTAPRKPTATACDSPSSSTTPTGSRPRSGASAGVAQHRRDHARAGDLYQESIDRFRGLNDRACLARSLVSFALTAHDGGEHDRARTLGDEGLGLMPDIELKGELAPALDQLGRAALAHGDVERATRLLTESLTVSHALGHFPGVASGLESIAQLAGTQGEPARMARLLAAATTLRLARGLPRPAADRDAHDGAVGAARAALGASAFEGAWAEGAAMPLERAIAHALAPPASARCSPRPAGGWLLQDPPGCPGYIRSSQRAMTA